MMQHLLAGCRTHKVAPAARGPTAGHFFFFFFLTYGYILLYFTIINTPILAIDSFSAFDRRSGNFMRMYISMR
jgi:hypothetical protein